jgi:hypothetical protein
MKLNKTFLDERIANMKTSLWMVGLLSIGILMSGCSPAFWGGAAGGVVGTGAGYEVHAKSELNKLDADLKAGKIDQKEYDIRKDQIQRDSVFQ